MASHLRWFELTFPRDAAAEQVLAFVRCLSGLRRPWWRALLTGQPVVCLEIRADHSGLRHLLGVPPGMSEYVLAQLRQSLPGIRTEEATREPEATSEALELRLNNNLSPLSAEHPAEASAAVMAGLLPLSPGEHAVIQWLIAPSRFPLESWAPWERPPSAAAQRALRDKQSEPAFAVAVRLGAASRSRERSQGIVRRLLGPFHLGTTPEATFRRRLIPSGFVSSQIAGASRPLFSWPALLNARELAAFLGLPIGGPLLPGLTLGTARHLPPSSELPERGRVIGEATFPGAERRLALSTEDSLRHLHAIGPTGVGKSTLLTSLAIQDAAAGHATIVIDPKGDLADDVLDRLPRARARDVIVFDPTDAERPVGFNLLEGVEAAPELITDHVVGIFHRLYSAFWGPRTDDILRAGVLTLAGEPGMTLCEVPTLLTDPGFRRRVLGRVDDHVLESFWGWFESLSEAERGQAIGPVTNKLRSFLLRKRLRNVIGQAESTISLEQVLAKRQVLVVSLAKGVLGEDAASLLGAALIARLWQAAQGRAALAPSERHPTFCHIDEFQDYLSLPTSLGGVLAQARGYGLGLTLSHQHLGQLPKPVREAVLANARSKVVFQTTATDARVLARELGPELTAEDLQSLGAFEAYVAAAAGRRVLPPTSIKTLPPGKSTGLGERIRTHSRERYGRPAGEVEREIRARSEREPEPSAVGTRRRS